MREQVRVTDVLREALVSDGYDPDEYAAYFGDWKALGLSGEFEDPYFGKDGWYREPKRGGRTVLCHVHIAPESDPEQMEKWNRAWSHRSRKVSDAALIYTHDPQHGYLLLFIVHEPHAHEACDMRVPASAQMMNRLADAAEAFIQSGDITL